MADRWRCLNHSKFIHHVLTTTRVHPNSLTNTAAAARSGNRPAQRASRRANGDDVSRYARIDGINGNGNGNTSTAYASEAAR